MQTIKTTRSKVEYYFTLSPFLPLYIMDNFSYVDQITTLDSDICFFSDPSIIFESYNKASVLITPHDFPAKTKDYERFGLYNVSFQSFKNNADARTCLEDWKMKCSEWCYDYFDDTNSRFADQKYLDEWETKFNNVHVIKIPGAGLAPWNIDRYTLTRKANKFFVAGKPLIFYHFHGLRLLKENFALPNFAVYRTNVERIAIKIYHPYLLKLKAWQKHIQATDKQILRNNNLQNKKIIKVFVETDDVIFFNKLTIFNIKLKPLYIKYQRFLKMIHGRTNRLKNFY